MLRFLTVLVVCFLVVPARLDAQTADEYVKRADTLFQWEEEAKAIPAYTQALAVANAKDPKEKQLIFHAYYHRGYAWAGMGDYDKAIADISHALAIDPNCAGAYFDRGNVWMLKVEYDKAIADFTKALAIYPDCVDTYIYRASAWKAKGEYAKAIADYTKITGIVPKYSMPYEALAWIYATCPDAKCRDGRKAVEYANKAVQLGEIQEWYYRGTLAAAYAESGDFAKAREFQEKAIESASEKEKQKLISRLELYKQGKPYHEPPVKK
jgi:tetratricopeptide (TPR) repeat protein